MLQPFLWKEQLTCKIQGEGADKLQVHLKGFETDHTLNVYPQNQVLQNKNHTGHIKKISCGKCDIMTSPFLSAQQ